MTRNENSFNFRRMINYFVYWHGLCFGFIFQAILCICVFGTFINKYAFGLDADTIGYRYLEEEKGEEENEKKYVT